MSLLPSPIRVGALAATAALVHAQSWHVTAPVPEPRIGASMALDPTSGRLLLVGGKNTEYQQSQATAVRVGTRWNPLAVTSPPERYGAGIATDPVRGRVVLFGGVGLFTGPRSDMYEWDGSTWLNVTPPVVPQVQGNAIMSWHGGTARVVLYGAGLSRNETWEWDGVAWVQRFPSTNPGSRTSMMSYDAQRDRIVLFGGADLANHLLADTWEWDGSNWIDVQPPVEPPPQSGAMAFDPLRNRTVLFGTGLSGTGTWEYDGATWLARSPAHAPPSTSVMAMDLARGRIVLHGGQTGSASLTPRRLNETWEWDGTDWTRVDGTLVLPEQITANVPIEPATGQMLLYLGSSAWRLEADGWRVMPAPAVVPALGGGEMVGDLAHGNVLAFPAGGAAAYTWTLQGGIWTQRSPSREPSFRAGHAMAFDPALGLVFLFGGGDATHTTLSDTWFWDGQDWTQVPGTGPPARCLHRMCADPAGGGVLLFGGSGPPTGLRGDTWRLAAFQWQQVAATGPSARLFHAMAADPLRNRAVLVGGQDSNGPVPSDHWEWDGTQWTRIGLVPQARSWWLGESRRGVVLVLDGLAYELAPPTAAATPYGSGCLGAAGVPRLAGGGQPALGSGLFQIVLDRARGGAFALVVADFARASLPPGVCGPLVVNPTVVMSAVTAPSGSAQWALAIPYAPALRALRLCEQAAVLDPAGAFLGLASLSNGLELLLDF